MGDWWHSTAERHCDIRPPPPSTTPLPPSPPCAPCVSVLTELYYSLYITPRTIACVLFTLFAPSLAILPSSLRPFRMYQQQSSPTFRPPFETWPMNSSSLLPPRAFQNYSNPNLIPCPGPHNTS